jgi:hypothetical protein
MWYCDCTELDRCFGDQISQYVLEGSKQIIRNIAYGTLTLIIFCMDTNTVENCLPGMSATWPAPDKLFFPILDILTKYI